MVFAHSPDVDDYFVTGAETIILWCGCVFVGFECQLPRIEHFVPENLSGLLSVVVRAVHVFDKIVKIAVWLGFGVSAGAGAYIFIDLVGGGTLRGFVARFYAVDLIGCYSFGYEFATYLLL